MGYNINAWLRVQLFAFIVVVHNITQHLQMLTVCVVRGFFVFVTVKLYPLCAILLHTDRQHRIYLNAVANFNYFL